jgi:transcriptional regulator with XRE-family HTH domain
MNQTPKAKTEWQARVWALKSKGMTAQSIAEITNASHAMIWKIDNGEGYERLEYYTAHALITLCHSLGIRGLSRAPKARLSTKVKGGAA